MRTDPPFHADHVGRVLRPESLLNAMARYLQDDLSTDVLRVVEDAANEAHR